MNLVEWVRIFSQGRPVNTDMDFHLRRNYNYGKSDCRRQLGR
jgi:hypothetical protein